MTLNNCTKIYDYLLEQGNEGKTISIISSELNIPAKEVEKYLKQFTSSFVQVNESQSYTVNRNKDSSREFLIKEFQGKEPAKNKYFFWFLIFFTIFMSLITVLNSEKGI